MMRKTVTGLSAGLCLLLSGCVSVATGPDSHLAGVSKHEACIRDDGSSEAVADLVGDAGFSLKNIQLIYNGDVTWVGGSVFDGIDMASRAEVWLLDDQGRITGVSGGAHLYSTADGEKDFTMLDEYAVGVRDCVVIESDSS